jgi:hypothetical protein
MSQFFHPPVTISTAAKMCQVIKQRYIVTRAMHRIRAPIQKGKSQFKREAVTQAMGARTPWVLL